MSKVAAEIGYFEAPSGGNRFYQGYEVEEDIERTSSHYEKDPEFFLTFMGSKWHSYSCDLWEEGFDITQAEEKKFDKLALLMRLEPGMRILDVGCGWGGPIVYLCEKYGAVGNGITISPMQIPSAESRAARHGVDATFEVVHWKNLPEEEQYDVVFTDEVITHFNDIEEFFSKCHRVLKPGGMMVHKELHLTRADHAEMGPASEHVHKLYGYTGNYRPLYQELQALDKTDFLLSDVFQMSMDHYYKTLDVWLKNLFDNRERMKEITSPTFYKDFRAYLKAVRMIFTRTELLSCDVYAARKV
jgi:cyclopropane-fatty-acyl-phospholipid synthase